MPRLGEDNDFGRLNRANIRQVRLARNLRSSPPPTCDAINGFSLQPFSAKELVMFHVKGSVFSAVSAMWRSGGSHRSRTASGRQLDRSRLDRARFLGRANGSPRARPAPLARGEQRSHNARNADVRGGATAARNPRPLFGHRNTFSPQSTRGGKCIQHKEVEFCSD